MMCSVSLVLFPAMGNAAESKTATVTWNYGQIPGLAGFKLFHQGEFLCQTDNPDDREISCPILVTVETNDFTLTAFDITNNESAPSEVITVLYSFTASNSAPVAENLSFSGTEDTVLINSLAAFDADNDVVSFTLVGLSFNGVVELIDPLSGQFRYTPNPDYSGTDTFTYRANDGTADSNLATVTITVTPTNDPPVAAADTATTLEDSAITIAVLANDYDVDSDPLSIVGVSLPASGSAIISNSNIIYTPGSNYSGPDSFTYQLSDGKLIVQGSVTIVVQGVNDAPVSFNMSIATEEDTAVFGTLSAADIDGSILAYSLVSNTVNGEIELLDVISGSFKYTPAANIFGQDSFTFKASDGGANSNTATVTLYVSPLNDSPVANSGPDQNVMMGDSVMLDASNSYDIDSAITAIKWVQIGGPNIMLSDSTAVQPSFETSELTLESSSLAFQVTVTDFEGAQSQDTSIVNVSWINAAPIAEAGNDQTVFEGEEVVLDGSQSTDPDDGISVWSWSQISGPMVALLDASAPQVSFIAPDSNITGETLVFELLIIDAGGLQSLDTIRVNVSWINEPPVANAGLDQTVDIGVTVLLDATSSSDRDDGIQSVQWTQTRGVPVTLSNPVAFQTTFITPEMQTPAELEFMVTVTDFSGLQQADVVTITVMENNITPQVIISSNTMGPASRGRWVKVYIELPDGYNVEEIDIDTITMSHINGIEQDPPLETQGPAEIGDTNNNGAPDLMVKFDRQGFSLLLMKGDNMATISGRLFDDTLFEQTALVVY
ncbi:MAG: tandem-95 repeat protein [Proteobacteria bacterium]|nr:tandem-95 repeat protein [Pseudomonadota bacterium]MBU1708619.1 tandem-95 repeat protein [Pseudomonadota bacterium]